MNLYNQIKYNGYRINIYYDDEARVKRMTISVRFIRHIVATARRRSLMTTSISTRFLKGISEISGNRS